MRVRVDIGEQVLALFGAAADHADRLPAAGPAAFLDHVLGQEIAGDSLVRRSPTALAMESSFSPFWAESTKPLSVRCGLSAASAASVAPALTASTMRL